VARPRAVKGRGHHFVSVHPNLPYVYGQYNQQWHRYLPNTDYHNMYRFTSAKGKEEVYGRPTSHLLFHPL